MLPWVIALAALFAVLFMVGAIGTALLFGGRSEQDPPSPGHPVPAKSNPGKRGPQPES